jgi:pyruvate formate lyase activating enzyme
MYYPNRAPHPEYACDKGAVDTPGSIDRTLCLSCRHRPCVTVWRHPSFEISGFDETPAQIARFAQEYRPLFSNGGGVTFGGGEPLLQSDELMEATALIRASGINVTIETNASTAAFTSVPGSVDLMICDLKCVSETLHIEWTGVSNLAVLDNLRHAASMQTGLLVRIPLVTGFNDGEDECRRMAAFIGGLAAGRRSLDVEILRMHHIGAPKYAALGMEYAASEIPVPSAEAARRLASHIESFGAKVKVR